MKKRDIKINNSFSSKNMKTLLKIKKKMDISNGPHHKGNNTG